jgi:membrane-associated protease RseP (regulator of RpoE activity)
MSTLLYLLVQAAVFVAFVAGRRLAARAFGLAPALPPFSEAPLGARAGASLGARAGVFAAGIALAYGFAAALCVAGNLSSGTKPSTRVDVMPGRPAEAAGIQRGDRIVTIGGREIKTWDELASTVARSPDRPVDVVLDRSGQPLRVTVTPSPEGKIGVTSIGDKMSAGEALAAGVVVPAQVLAEQVAYFKPTRTQAADVLGPVGVVKEISKSQNNLLLVGIAASGSFLSILLGSLVLSASPRRRERFAGLSEAFEVDAAHAPAPDAPVRPFRRFAARTIDGLVTLALLAAPLPVPAGVRALLGFVAWVPLEVLLLSTWGTTPGKWLLEIRVRNAAGEKLGATEAWHRVANVWAWGLGFGWPPVSFVLPLLALWRLSTRRRTYWDELGSYQVDHRPIGTGRTIAIVAMVLLFFGVLVYGAMRDVGAL